MWERWERCLNPLFQNQYPPFWQYPDLGGWNILWQRGGLCHRIFHPSPTSKYFWINLKDTSSHISIDLDFLQNICQIFSESFISYHGWGKLSNLCYSNYTKMHLQVKKINQDISTHSPRQNSPPGSYHHPAGRWNFFIPPRENFFKNLFPRNRIGQDETMIWVYHVFKTTIKATHH